MRTAPKSNPALSCEYDDSPGNGADEVDRDASMASEDGDENPEGKKKKKRKTSGEPRRKNRKDEDDEETEMLRKKIGTSHYSGCAALTTM